MATYAIGDLQGCLEPLRRLLDRCCFDPAADTLWFCGDLVNRGPASLDTLRFVHGLGDAAVVVLGNHDLHLLAVAAGSAPARNKDTLDEILAAPDRDELLQWLRERPLVHHERGHTMVHAGIPAPWTIAEAVALADEVSRVVRGPDARAFFDGMYGDKPARWSPDLAGIKRLRYITNALTRMRYCTADGALDLNEKRPPGDQPRSLVPWFEVPGRRSAADTIVFGHWATLQVKRPLDPGVGVIHLDTGCVWGGCLSAVRLEDHVLFEISC